MENKTRDLYLYVRLKKNYSEQNIIKGQHFRLLCETVEGRELTYLEKLDKLKTDEKCVIDPEKYDKFQIPLSNAVVDCKDLEDITKEVFENNSLFFTESSYFGDKDGREEMKKEEKAFLGYIKTMFPSVSDTEVDSDDEYLKNKYDLPSDFDTKGEKDENVNKKDTLEKE